MATWKSSKAWEYDEACDGYTPGRVSWEYQTTADILTLRYDEDEGTCWGGKIEANKYETLLGFDRARASLEAMLDWDAVYNDGRIYSAWAEERK